MSGRLNVYKTLSVSSFMPPAMLDDVVDFLVANRSYILAPHKRNEAFRTRYFTQSLLSDLVQRLGVSGSDQAFNLIKLPNKTVALREAIDMTFVPIDLLQIKEMTTSSSKTLSLIPELNDKMLINITDITKVNGDFVDVSKFHQRVVRDFLSRNFYTSSSNVWISSALVRYVAKVYSMTIGVKLARFFGLLPNAQMFIQTVFCAFFVGKMTSPETAESFLKAHSKPLGLPQSVDLMQILAMIHDVIGTSIPQSLEDVFAVIDASAEEKLKNKGSSRLNRSVMVGQFSSMAPESPVGMIALEYPPYFLFLIMSVISGERIGLAFHMKNLNLINEGKDVFEQLLRTPSFLHIN